MNIEVKDKINELRSFFIEQVKSAEWAKYSYCRYMSQYFELSSEEYVKGKKDWYILFQKEKITPKEIGISKIYFWYLKRLIEKNSKNYEQNIRNKKIATVVDGFFLRNKELKRDSKLDKLLNQ
jgi:hypothetical protein